MESCEKTSMITGNNKEALERLLSYKKPEAENSYSEDSHSYLVWQ